MFSLIPFNKPIFVGSEIEYINEAIKNSKISGDGAMTAECNKMLEDITHTQKALLTTSCTHALEMAAILCDIEAGDEVIMPSFTFVTTANAFVLRGATIVFVDIRPDTQNVNENLIEKAITAKTKVIVPVHYAGVSCEMDEILRIARKYGLKVVEDAAQGVMSKYKDKALGSIGDFGCFSFHETKNYTMGEGGALLINDGAYIEKAEIIREKGTNRSRFLRGQIDKYTWVDIGSSYLPSELNAAYLLPQLKDAAKINNDRLATWDRYYDGLTDLQADGLIELPVVPEHCEHNAHMFYIKLANIEQRQNMIDYLSRQGINAIFHYVPLHSAYAGLKWGRFTGEDKYTTKESEKLLRLPMYYGLTEADSQYVINTIHEFFVKQNR